MLEVLIFQALGSEEKANQTHQYTYLIYQENSPNLWYGLEVSPSNYKSTLFWFSILTVY